LQYDKVVFLVEPSEPAKAAIGKYVTVFDYPDGRLSIRHTGVELAKQIPTHIATAPLEVAKLVFCQTPLSRMEWRRCRARRTCPEGYVFY
jgi:hypothetical protein